MNKDILEGKWKQLRGEIRRRWGKLTDRDLDEVQGSYEKLLGKIQERYGNQKDEVEKEVDRFFSSREEAPTSR